LSCDVGDQGCEVLLQLGQVHGDVVLVEGSLIAVLHLLAYLGREFSKLELLDQVHNNLLNLVEFFLNIVNFLGTQKNLLLEVLSLLSHGRHLIAQLVVVHVSESFVVSNLLINLGNTVLIQVTLLP